MEWITEHTMFKLQNRRSNVRVAGNVPSLVFGYRYFEHIIVNGEHHKSVSRL